MYIRRRQSFDRLTTAFSCRSVSIYTASKFAVAGWTRSFSLLPQVCNVRVNAVCPYWVETDLAHDLSNRAHGGDPFQKLVEKSPRTKVETVVEAVLTLVEDDKRNCEYPEDKRLPCANEPPFL